MREISQVGKFNRAKSRFTETRFDIGGNGITIGIEKHKPRFSAK